MKEDKFVMLEGTLLLSTITINCYLTGSLREAKKMSYKIHITSGLLGLLESQNPPRYARGVFKPQKDLEDPRLSEFYPKFLASLELPVKL